MPNAAQHDDATSYRFGKSFLTVRIGDIITSDAQAIVSSDDTHLTMSGNVSLAIWQAGGSAIPLDAAKRIPADIGDVVVTTAGNLPARFVFHAVTTTPPGQPDPGIPNPSTPDTVLPPIISRCLSLLDPLRIQSIAFPAIGAGTAGFPREKVAAQMARQISTYLLSSETSLEVSLYLYNPGDTQRDALMLDDFANAFSALVPTAKKHATETPAEPSRDLVFISYSHKDKKWFGRLLVMLKPLVRNKSIVLWEDTSIAVGDEWRGEINNALNRARVAVLLLSSDFLASEFIAKKELPPLLAARKKGELRILPVILKSCLWKEDPGLNQYQAIKFDKPLAELSRLKRDAALVRICQEIKKAAAD